MNESVRGEKTCVSLTVFISFLGKQTLIHLWQYCRVISIYLLSSLSHFKPLTAYTLVHSLPLWLRLDGSRLDPIVLWCQMIVSDRSVYRCYLTRAAHSPIISNKWKNMKTDKPVARCKVCSNNPSVEQHLGMHVCASRYAYFQLSILNIPQCLLFSVRFYSCQSLAADSFYLY